MVDLAAEFKNLIAAHRQLLSVAASSKKPSDADLAKIAGPQGPIAEKVGKLAGDNRPSPLFVNLSAVSEAVQAFFWFGMVRFRALPSFPHFLSTNGFPRRSSRLRYTL